MNNKLKIVLGSALFLIVLISVLWMYKFNYLSAKDWYDVDWNKINVNNIEQEKILQKKINTEKLRSLKWFELYSWKENNEWNFSLLLWTNRIKTCEEIIEAKVIWIDKIKKLVSNVEENNLFEITDRISNCKEFQQAPSEVFNHKWKETIYFDPEDEKWKDEFGICNSCTEKNGFWKDWKIEWLEEVNWIKIKLKLKNDMDKNPSIKEVKELFEDNYSQDSEKFGTDVKLEDDVFSIIYASQKSLKKEYLNDRGVLKATYTVEEIK